MEEIKNTIKKIVERLQDNSKAQNIVRVWDSVIDGETLKKTKVENEKNGVLVVKVRDNATMYILNMKKHKIIKQINEQSEKKIKNIRFKINT